MDNLVIEPQVGIGKVKLGMSRDEVHKLMGTDFFTMKISNIVCDCYSNSCLRIEYDNYMNVISIEIVNGLECQVIFEGVDVFKTKASNLVTYVEQFSNYQDTLDAQAGFMYLFEDLGMTLYRSIVFKDESMDEPWFLQKSQEQKEDELRFQFFESVSVWSKGYYKENK